LDRHADATAVALGRLDNQCWPYYRGNVFTRDHIVEEIRRTAQANGGRPLGIRRFEAETGIKSSDWMGKFWARWGDALLEAGFEPNTLQGPRGDDEVFEKLAMLAGR
jgi:hypothetical protein